MTINKRIQYIYRLLFGYKKERSPDTWYKTDES